MTASDKTYPSITTARFSVTNSTFARVAIRELVGRWWWVALVPFSGCIIAATFNPIWLIVALIWILLLLPPATLIAYYNYLLHPSAASMSQVHSVSFFPDNIIVEFDNQDNDEGPRPHDDIIVPTNEIEIMKIVSDFLLFKTRRPSRHDKSTSSGLIPPLLIIPLNSFKMPEDIAKVTSLY